MRATRVVSLPSIVFVLVSCTGGGPPDRDARPPVERAVGAAPDVLVLGTGDGPVTVSAANGSVLLERQGAMAGPDGSLVYATTPAAGPSTRLVTLDATTGSVMSRTRIPGSLAVRVASVSGRSVALMAPLDEGLDPWTPVPRSRTTIVVADPTGEMEPRRYHLRGNFEPEAFSSDDARLFLIQYLPAEAPEVYRVTVLELDGGRVHPVTGRFKSPPERMPGVRLSQVLAPDAEQLYTLYSNEGSGYGWNGAGGTEAVTFVHVLNLRKGWAFCAGLPEELWGQPARAQAMAVSPDASRLYVVDTMRATVAVMDTTSLEIVQEAAAPSLVSAGRASASALMSVDGRRLFVGGAGDGREVVVLDAADLGVDDRWRMPDQVSGFGLSPDGRRLYVALGDRVAMLDPETGDQLGDVAFDGAESVFHVATAAG
jgi:hypothetical protein